MIDIVLTCDRCDKTAVYGGLSGVERKVDLVEIAGCMKWYIDDRTYFVDKKASLLCPDCAEKFINLESECVRERDMKIKDFFKK